MSGWSKITPMRHCWLVFVVVALPACKSTPTSVLLTIEAATGLPTPDELRLDVFNPGGSAVKDRRLPESGAPALPDDVVLFPKESSGLVRILVRALAGGAEVGQGVTSVELESGAQVKATVTVHAGALPDRDGDGIPDEIDSCPDLPNPEQGPCNLDAGADMGDAAPDLFLVPDLSCDGDNDTYLALVCGGLDCDDSDPKVNPGANEGPPGSARCADGIDNDCDGSKDLDDTGCKSCTVDGDCDDDNICTSDACKGGKCANEPSNEGASCDDGNACTKGETCQSGLCGGGAGVTCKTPEICLVASCDPAQGCVTQAKPDGVSCDDGAYCTVKDACKGGACQGEARDCSASAPVCHEGSCDESQGGCVYSAVADGKSCDDGDPCTQGEVCSNGSCVPPGPTYETVDTLNVGRRSDRALATDSSGKLHTVYTGYGNPKLFYATNAGGNWSTATVDASSADVGYDAAVAVGLLGSVYIVYTDMVGHTTRLAWRPAGVTSWIKQSISAGDGHNSIAVEAAGKLHISFQQNGKLYYMGGNVGSLAKTLVDEVAGGDKVGYHSSIAVDGSGAAHIAHGQGTTTNTTSGATWDQVKLLRYSTNVGGTWTTTTPAAVASGPYGGLASIAVDAAGGSVSITHTNATLYNATSGTLYLTSRSGGSWTTQVLGGSQSDGSFSSLLLDSKGHRHVAFRNPATNDLTYITDASGTWTSLVLEDMGAGTSGWAGIARETSGTIHLTYEKVSSTLRHAAFSACP